MAKKAIFKMAAATILKYRNFNFWSRDCIQVKHYICTDFFSKSVFFQNRTIFSQLSIDIDGWLYGMRMTSVVCNVPVLSQNDSTYHHSVFTT